ncbi:MAG TPA: hypothetical protein VM888_02500 [Chitinophagaceae bacterium]|jgi:hypothetical protein|nr:hypothetical protein [Chitinophagaceae bacterium]
MEQNSNAIYVEKRSSGWKKYLGIILLIILLVFGGIFYWRYYYVFGEGVKAGQLNYLVKKGYIFKTYEGKLIQSGFRGGAPGSIQSYEFEFSVEDSKVADTLMLNSGKVFELHYKEYMGTLPWRGHTKFIVDKIINMKAAPTSNY